MKTTLIAVSIGFVLATLAPSAVAQGINAPIPQPSPIVGSGSPGPTGLPSPVVSTSRGAEVGAGGTRSYEQMSGPGGGGIMTPNSNGTSTIIAPTGATQTVPTPR